MPATEAEVNASKNRARALIRPTWERLTEEADSKGHQRTPMRWLRRPQDETLVYGYQCTCGACGERLVVELGDDDSLAIYGNMLRPCEAAEEEE